MPSLSKTMICAVLVACSTLLTANEVRAAETDLGEIRGEIAKRHDEAVKRLQDWIAAPPSSRTAQQDGAKSGTANTHL